MADDYDIDPERAAMISRISSCRDAVVRLAAQLANSLANQQSADHTDDPMPPYTQGQDQVVPSTEGLRIYHQDEFIIILGLSQIWVTNQEYYWTCDANTDLGQLLVSQHGTISLSNRGGRLFVVEGTVATTNTDRPNPKPREDDKRCLKVEGYENDVVIRTPRCLSLWDMTKRRFRREKFRGARHI